MVNGCDCKAWIMVPASSFLGFPGRWEVVPVAVADHHWVCWDRGVLTKTNKMHNQNKTIQKLGRQKAKKMRWWTTNCKKWVRMCTMKLKFYFLYYRFTPNTKNICFKLFVTLFIIKLLKQLVLKKLMCKYQRNTHLKTIYYIVTARKDN